MVELPLQYSASFVLSGYHHFLEFFRADGTATVLVKDIEHALDVLLSEQSILVDGGHDPLREVNFARIVVVDTLVHVLNSVINSLQISLRCHILHKNSFEVHVLSRDAQSPLLFVVLPLRFQLNRHHDLLELLFSDDSITIHIETFELFCEPINFLSLCKMRDKKLNDDLLELWAAAESFDGPQRLLNLFRINPSPVSPLVDPRVRQSILSRHATLRIYG